MITHTTLLESKVPEIDLDIYDANTDDTVSHSIQEFQQQGKWLVLFFYPADFTFVCPTELADLNKMKDEFDAIDAEVCVVSVDTVFSHKRWVETEKLLEGFGLKMISDRRGHLSKYFGCYNEQTGNSERGTIIISPEGVIKSIEIVTEPIGRSSTELVRKLRALHFVANNPGHACPASWNNGGVTLEPNIQMSGKVGEQNKID